MHSYMRTYTHTHSHMDVIVHIHLHYMQLQSCIPHTDDNYDPCGTDQCELRFQPTDYDQVFTCCCRESFCNAYVNIIFPDVSLSSSSPRLLSATIPTTMIPTTISRDCHVTNYCMAMIMTLCAFSVYILCM